MEKFTVIESLAVPLDRANVDTDQIIPKQFLRSISRTGFGDFLFDEWRYQDHGELGMDCTNRPRNKEFILNQAQYQGAHLLLARENFGCGSSREHAVWALLEYGFRAIIAPSFGDIFANNAVKNGLLPLVLPSAVIEQLFEQSFAQSTLGHLRVDLAAQTVRTAAGDSWRFDILEETKQRLLLGLDDIAATLQHTDEIRAYENQRRESEPWLFDSKSL